MQTEVRAKRDDRADRAPGAAARNANVKRNLYKKEPNACTPFCAGKRHDQRIIFSRLFRRHNPTSHMCTRRDCTLHGSAYCDTMIFLFLPRTAQPDRRAPPRRELRCGAPSRAQSNSVSVRCFPVHSHSIVPLTQTFIFILWSESTRTAHLGTYIYSV